MHQNSAKAAVHAAMERDCAAEWSHGDTHQLTTQTADSMMFSEMKRQVKIVMQLRFMAVHPRADLVPGFSSHGEVRAEHRTMPQSRRRSEDVSEQVHSRQRHTQQGRSVDEVRASGESRHIRVVCERGLDMLNPR